MITNPLTLTAFSAKSDIGFQYGLSDCQTGTSNAINGHSNEGHHSAAYINAYNQGLASCGNSGSNSGDNSASSNQPSTEQSDTIGGKLLCYGAGAILLLGGVPASKVIAAGQTAHEAGVCP
jgi:hypothetical protein